MPGDTVWFTTQSGMGFMQSDSQHARYAAFTCSGAVLEQRRRRYERALGRELQFQRKRGFVIVQVERKMPVA